MRNRTNDLQQTLKLRLVAWWGLVCEHLTEAFGLLRSMVSYLLQTWRSAFWGALPSSLYLGLSLVPLFAIWQFGWFLSQSMAVFMSFLPKAFITNILNYAESAPSILSETTGAVVSSGALFLGAAIQPIPFKLCHFPGIFLLCGDKEILEIDFNATGNPFSGFGEAHDRFFEAMNSTVQLLPLNKDLEKSSVLIDQIITQIHYSDIPRVDEMLEKYTRLGEDQRKASSLVKRFTHETHAALLFLDTVLGAMAKDAKRLDQAKPSSDVKKQSQALLTEFDIYLEELFENFQMLVHSADLCIVALDHLKEKYLSAGGLSYHVQHAIEKGLEKPILIEYLPWYLYPEYHDMRIKRDLLEKLIPKHVEALETIKKVARELENTVELARGFSNHVKGRRKMRIKLLVIMLADPASKLKALTEIYGETSSRELRRHVDAELEGPELVPDLTWLQD